MGDVIGVGDHSSLSSPGDKQQLVEYEGEPGNQECGLFDQIQFLPLLRQLPAPLMQCQLKIQLVWKTT